MLTLQHLLLMTRWAGNAFWDKKKNGWTNGASLGLGYRAAPLLTAGHLKPSVLKGASSVFSVADHLFLKGYPLFSQESFQSRERMWL